jgi:hypothetical protein
MLEPDWSYFLCGVFLILLVTRRTAKPASPTHIPHPNMLDIEDHVLSPVMEAKVASVSE